MVLIDIYGKTEPTIISKKLGIGICNPQNDWIEGLPDDFDEEYLVQMHEVKTNIFSDSNSFSKTIEQRYNYDKIVQLLNWKEDRKDSKTIIAEHLVEIQVLDFEHSLLKKINSNLYSPTCEIQYAKKFMNLCERVNLDSNCWKNIPMVTYDSDELFTKPLIINYLSATIDDKNYDVKKRFELGLSVLKKIGEKIDNFLLTEKDFWLLDYIINALAEKQYSSNAYYVFKILSLIEMLLINPSNNGRTQGEIERKLPQFLSNRIDNSKKTLYAEYMRKFRNKIAHGDFEFIAKLLKDYRNEFMKNFWYDEFEYSIDNWTYGNISLELDEALNNILGFMLNDKTAWENLRTN